MYVFECWRLNIYSEMGRVENEWIERTNEEGGINLDEIKTWTKNISSTRLVLKLFIIITDRWISQSARASNRVQKWIVSICTGRPIRANLSVLFSVLSNTEPSWYTLLSHQLEIISCKCECARAGSGWLESCFSYAWLLFDPPTTRWNYNYYFYKACVLLARPTS